MKFLDFCNTMEKIESTTKKKDKIFHFAEFLKQISLYELPSVCYYAAGRPFAKSSELKIQFGWSSFMAIVYSLTKRTKADLTSFYRKKSDIGSLVEYALWEKRPLSKSLDSFFNTSENFSGSLTIETIQNSFIQLASLKGKGSLKIKKNIILNLLKYMTGLESKYLVRIITSDTRTGFREGLLLDAIALAFNRNNQNIRYAHMILNDIGETAKIAKTKNINFDFATLDPKIFQPLRLMLATKIDSIEDALNLYKPIICESKLDGFRSQIHFDKMNVKVYSRNFEDVTKSFPEIVHSVTPDLKENFAPCIIDGEIVAMKEDKPVFFQDLLTRIQRKRKIKIIAEQVPVYLFVFDILLLKGKSLLKSKLVQRKKILEKLPQTMNIKVLTYNLIDNKIDIESYLNQAIQNGSEGLMLKDPNSVYLAGKRGKNWLKLKVSLPTLDLVILAAEWGHGRRTGMLSNYHLAALDKTNDKFIVIGKTFKGLSDEEITMLTKKLVTLKVYDQAYGIEVKPQIVVEVEYNNIQESSKYESKLALRFARIKRIRSDKDIDEIDTIETVRKIYNNQLKHQHRVRSKLKL